MSDSHDDAIGVAFGLEAKREGDRRIDADSVLGGLGAAIGAIETLGGLTGSQAAREIAECLAGMMRTPLREIAIEAWNKRAEIQKYADVAKYPGAYEVKLKEHTITWTYRPYLMVSAIGLEKRVPLVADAKVTLLSPTLRIEAGRYRAITFGDATMSGTLRAEGIGAKLLEKKSTPRSIPGRISLGAEGIPIRA